MAVRGLLSLGVFALTSAVLAVPAQAVSVVDGKCISVADTKGCLFDGNIAPSTVAETQAKYNLYNNTHPSANPDITLTYLFKSDDGAGFPGTVTGSTNGTWSTPGYLINFLAVKASNAFVLYKLATPASSGTFTTADIPFKKNPHGLSHLTFFGVAAVPEPATWAMLILGFFAVGTAVRRRDRQSIGATA